MIFLLRSSLRLLAGCCEEDGIQDIPLFLRDNPIPHISVVPDAEFPVCYAEKGRLLLTLASPKLGQDILDFTAGTAKNVVPDMAKMTVLAEGEKLRTTVTPTSISVEQKGRQLHYSAKGKAVHAAIPQKGINAIELLARWAQKAGMPQMLVFAFIADVAKSWDGSALGIAHANSELSGLTCCCSTARFIDGRIKLALDIRYPVPLCGETLLHTIQDRGKAAGFTCEKESDSPPYVRAKSDPVLQALMRVYRKHTGLDKPPYAMAGAAKRVWLPCSCLQSMDSLMPRMRQFRSPSFCMWHKYTLPPLWNWIRSYFPKLCRVINMIIIATDALVLFGQGVFLLESR